VEQSDDFEGECTHLVYLEPLAWMAADWGTQIEIIVREMRQKELHKNDWR
jgi:hypothetical protein